MGHRSLANVLLVTGLAAAMLAGGAASSDAATTHRATALQPPVIHESFTPLPCHHGTTVGEEGCAEQQILKSDRQIDQLNADIFKRLDVASRKDLLAGHRAWLGYRKAYCLSASDVYRGGTEAGVVMARCEASVNAAHVKELKGFLAGLSQN